ncbi:type VII secretion protein EccB [Plantactinospora sp. KBS50]|uniref:type VII secretion protein EccB n=1 Tax=Plantactinospora sp. KBS50 TaxID=2024580 RepID=UPI000BAAEB52|nr:type VII secretion protein EccB [Plantactinospora sp. KBS50]ASW53233.1 type VII secretion protein EccB [Plantactinospora sp. KBS50]
MPARQDQLHSYQFVVQRMVAALVVRETDPARSPFRRSASAALAGLLVAGIGLGVAALYGVATGGADQYRDGTAVIVERETGARYVYRGERLHPVLNYASALLIVGSAEPRTVLVSRRSIRDVPRGTPLGLAGAPDSLPGADRLTGQGWAVCSAAADATGAAPASVVRVGRPPLGRPLGDAGVLARHPDGSLHLLWHGRHHLIRDPDLVLAAFAWSSRRAVPVAPALLAALPPGADLAPVPLSGSGRPSRVPGAAVGEVFVVQTQGGARQYAVAAADGLATITALQADLLLTAGGQAEPTVLAQGRFAAAPKRPDLVPQGGMAPPASAPDLVDTGGATLCGRIEPGSAGPPELRIDAGEPGAADGVDAGPHPAGEVRADRVAVPAGGGAVVRAMPAPGASGGAVCVVTDLGRRYAVPDPDVLAMLGYRDVRPVELPAAVLALLPPGPVLEPQAARSPAPGP